MNFKTSLKRMTAAVLSALLLCGGLSACTTGGSGSETTDGTGTGTGGPTTDTVTTPAASGTEKETADSGTETEPAPDSLILVGDGVSAGIVYDADCADCLYAAYTLRDSLKALYGTELPVIRSDEDADSSVRIVLHDAATAEETGDCGFTVKAEGQTLVVAAPSLAGFDGAFRRILLDGAGAGTLSVPLAYSVAETVNSGAGYSFDADDFHPEYASAPFYNDKADSVAYVCNAMWHMFGAIDDGQSLVYRFGNEPTYYEWMSEKIMWSGNAGYINELKGKIQTFPQTQNGYMWSWSTYPYWQVSDTYCIHYDGTFRYIAAVYDIISWENSVEFLSAVDNNAAGGEYAELDASKGRTVLEKVEAAWNYIYYSLKGEEGLIRLTEDSVFLTADGSSRFDYVKATGKTCWDNTGLPRSAASNYWDNLCFGNLDAYESALFYEATQAMIGIYGMLGGEYLDRIPALTELSKTIHDLYDRTFWSDTTGRYIACIDVNGNAVDYGFTFLNFEALKYGLGDAARAQSVFSWVDGTRTVEGDTRTGEEIMSYLTMMRKTSQYRRMKSEAPDLRLAAVTNTLAINNKENQKTGQVWWHGPAGIDPFGSAAYGAHCENGGYIFYPVFYELMARVRYQGAQAVTDRYAQIARVYEFNRLKTDDMVPGSTNWLEGVIGEFPESGLVPTAYMYGLMGVSAEPDGLHVVPSFNDTYEVMGVTSMTYGGHAYGLEENRNGALTITCLDGTLAVKLCYQPPRFTAFTVTLYAKDGTSSAYEATVDGNGMLCLDLIGENIDRVEILPKLR